MHVIGPELRRHPLGERGVEVRGVAVGGDDRDHPLLGGAGGVGSRRARTDRVGDGRLAEQHGGGEALRVQRVDDLAVPIAPHAGEVEVARHSGSLYAEIAFSPRILRCASSGSGAIASRSSFTTSGWNSGCG